MACICMAIDYRVEGSYLWYGQTRTPVRRAKPPLAESSTLHVCAEGATLIIIIIISC